MRKFTLFLLGLFATVSAMSQVQINQGFETGSALPTGWTTIGFFNSNYLPCEGAQSIRRNFYNFATVGSLTTPNFPTGSNGEAIDISFQWKTLEYSTASGVGGNMDVQYSTDNGSTWITVGSINSTAETSCATWNGTIAQGVVPAGSDFKMRLNGAWVSGNFYFLVDNIIVNQAALTVPNCTSITAPASGAVNVATSKIAWSMATGGPSGYKVSVGTTSGGTDFLNMMDVGNVLTYNLGGLAASTTYYVTVTPYNSFGNATGPCTESTFTTCGAVTALPWTESFEGLTTTGPSVFPGCWTKENGDWASTASTSYTTPRTGTKYIRDFNFANNEYIWTKGFQLEAGTSYDFSAWVQGDGGIGWVVDMFANNNPSSTGATQLGGSFEVPGTGTIAIQPYNEMRRVFVPVTSGVYFFGLRVNQPAYPWYVAFDDLKVEVTPSCPQPNSLAVDDITATSAYLSWTAAGSLFNVQYGPSGFTVGTGTVVSGLTIPLLQLENLTPLTTYHYYVQNDCGNGDLSEWAGPYTFKTTCPIYAAPYLEDFSTFTTIAPQCWIEGDNGNLFDGPATFNSSNWEKDGFSNNGTAGAARATFVYTGANEWLISPLISVPTNGQLKFYAAVTQANSTSAPVSPWESDDVIEVLASTNGFSEWSVIYTFNSTNVPPVGGAPYIIDLTAYANQDVRFAFRLLEGPDNGPAYLDFSVDNFEVREAPTCPEPTSLLVSNVTFNSVQLAWTTSGTETEWEYVIQPQGTGIPTGSGISTLTNPVVDSTLLPVTAYEVYIRSVCSETDSSPWIGPSFFTTLCAPYSIPFLENFATFVPACWEKGDNGDLVTGPATLGLSNWVADGFANNGFVGAMKINLYDLGKNEWIISPKFNIPSAGNYELKFLAAATQTASTLAPTNPWEADDYVQVLVSTGLTDWTVLYTYNNTNVPSNSGVNNVIDLSAYTGQTVRFAFRAVEGANNGTADIEFFIDNFEVRETLSTVPACTTNLVATPNASCGNFATSIVWDLTSGADGYKLTVGTTAGGNEVMNNVDLGNALSYNFIGNIGQVYYATVKAYNTVGDSAGCAEISFTHATTGCFCTSVPTSVDGTGISNILLGTATFTNGSVTYTDYTSTPVNLAQGANTPLNLTFNTYSYDYDTNVWIDFNDNYTFEASEQVYDGVSADSSPNTLNASFMMPATAALGSHRMRIAAADADQAIPNPCYSGGHGVTLDFQVNIVEGTLSATGFDIDNFKAYPNPVKDVLNVAYASEITSVTVYNLLGQTVLSKHLNATSGQIDMSNLTSGNYLVKVISKEGSKTIKVIKN